MPYPMSEPPRWSGGMAPIPADGDMEIGRSFGVGVRKGEWWGENSSASERVERLTTEAREARAAAVAAAASSTVPV
jgi:hypothetical protein